MFLGDHHPVTLAIAIGCLVGSIFMFRYQLRLGGWGPNIRMGVSTVVVFWTFVEVFARNKILTEFWVSPLQHIPEMVSILVSFLALGVYVAIKSARGKKSEAR